MSSADELYIITLLVYLAVNTIAVWSLNLQFGVAGVMNFGFILFQSIGAYTAAVLSLGHSSYTYNTYIIGWSLPFPLPIIGAGIAGALLALLIGSFALRPERRDFQATIMLVLTIMASAVVSTQTGWFNGVEGLYAVPHPLEGGLHLGLTSYGWFFVGLAFAIAALVYLVISRMTGSPWGRRLRAMRENQDASASLGINVKAESLKVFVVGGAIAAVSGAIFVEFIQAWSPSAWGIGETFVYLVAVIVGGLGNNAGAALGAFLVCGVFIEAPSFVPGLNFSQDDAALQSVLIACLTLLVLWFRPRGILPERKRKLAAIARAGMPQPGVSVGGPSMAFAGAGPAVALAGPPAAALVGGSQVAALSGPPSISQKGPGSTGLAPPTANSPVPREDGAPPAIDVRDLVREFGGVRAVDGISFTVPQGEITGLIGPNGAGKSTVLKMIAGALAPTSGEILIGDHNVAGWSQHRVARIGVVRTFQHSSEFGRLTVLENLLVAAPEQPGASFRGSLLGRHHYLPRQKELLADAYQLLVDFGLEGHADTYAGELSGGQRRLVEIMRAMMARPRILLLDEPMAGVTPVLRSTIEDHLRRLAGTGLTMLMVEHELGAVERVCDSVLVMAQGRFLASGAMSDLRQNEEVISAYLVG